MAAADLTPDRIARFFESRTPQAWVDEACARIPALLLDHANCELKAASTAIGFIYRYPERSLLVQRMSRLAREELRHFEQARKLLQAVPVTYERLSASRYASSLREAVRDSEPGRLLDLLIVGAVIEARSCERFAALIPCLPAELARFYSALLSSEARHFEEYLKLAKSETNVDDAAIAKRIAEVKVIEAALITEPDAQFRFHSGVPLSRRGEAGSG